MLKLQKNCTIENQSFEDFILLIFVLTDDLYKSVAPDCVKFRPNIEKTPLSDSEIITIAICGEQLRQKKFVAGDFTKISSYLKDEYLIADSFPLEVCKFGRAHFCRAFKFEGATYGHCAAKKQTYFAYKVHALTTVEGAVMISDFTDFYCIFGDKGYVDKNLEQELKQRGQRLLALKRENAKNNLTDEEREFILKYRKRIETVFAQLTAQFNIERVLAKTFVGLSIRLLTKFLAHNICLFINKMFRLNFSKVKSLIF